MNLIHKSMLLLATLLQAAAFVSAQEKMSEFISLDTIINLPTIKTSTRTQITAAQHGREVVFSCYDAHKNDDTIIFYVVDIDLSSCKQYSLILPGTAQRLISISEPQIEQLAYDGHNIYLTLGERLLKCHISSDTSDILILDWQVQQELPATYMNLLDDHTLLFSYCYPYPGITNVMLYTVDVDSKQVISYEEPEYNHVFLSQLKPYKNIDVCDGKILWANRNEYSFSIYDSAINVKERVLAQHTPFKGIDGKALKRIAQKEIYGADLIDAVWKYYENRDRIDFAYYVDSNNIAMVRAPWSNKNNHHKEVLDWWKFIDGQWKMVMEGIEDRAFFEVPSDSSLQRSNAEIGWLSGARVVVFNDKFVCLSPNGTPIYPVGISRRAYYASRDKWLQVNDTFLQISIISHTFAG